MKDDEKFNYVKECADNNGNKKHCALKLGITIWQLNRLIAI